MSSSPAPAALAPAAAFRLGPVRWLWVGQTLSNLGTQTSLYGLGIWLLQRQQLLLPLVSVAVTVQLAKVAVLPLAGRQLQRWPRLTVMLAANAVAVLATLGMAALLLGNSGVPAALFPLLAVAAAAEAVFALALATLIPLLVPQPQLPQVNGWLVGGDALVQFSTPALGAAVVASRGIGAVATLDALTFLVSMACLLLAGIPAGVGAAQRPPAAAAGSAPSSPGFRSTWRELLSRCSTRRLLSLSMLQSFVLACTEVLFPAWVLAAFGAAWLVPALLLNGVAYAVGVGVWLHLGDRGRLLQLLLAMQTLLLLGAALPRLAQVPLLWAGGVMAFTLAVPLVLTTLHGRWQRQIGLADQPRCFAVRFSGEWLARLLGLLTTVVLVDGIWRSWLRAGAAEAHALALVGGLQLLALVRLRRGD